MVTSRSVPQQTGQIFSALAGQKRPGLRLLQIGQSTNDPPVTSDGCERGEKSRFLAVLGMTIFSFSALSGLPQKAGPTKPSPYDSEGPW